MVWSVGIIPSSITSYRWSSTTYMSSNIIDSTWGSVVGDITESGLIELMTDVNFGHLELSIFSTCPIFFSLNKLVWRIYWLATYFESIGCPVVHYSLSDLGKSNRRGQKRILLCVVWLPLFDWGYGKLFGMRDPVRTEPASWLRCELFLSLLLQPRLVFSGF